MAHRLAPQAERDLDDIAYYIATETGSIENDALPIDWPDWDQDPAWRRVRDAARAVLARLHELDVR